MKISKKITFLIIIIVCILIAFTKSKAESSCLNNFTYNLNLGSTDNTSNGEVSRLQSYLYSINLLNTAPTGYYGELTRTAVAKYQISMNITPYGSVGPITRTALALSCNINSNTSNNISAVANNPIDNTQPFAPINTNLGCIESQYNYKIGSQDQALFGEITKLQTYLYQNNLMSYPPTGYYGELTQSAILQYQNLRNLPPTGMYDFPTRITLAKETCGGTTTLSLPIIYNNVSTPN